MIATGYKHIQNYTFSYKNNWHLAHPNDSQNHYDYIANNCSTVPLVTLHRNKMASGDEDFPSVLRDYVIDNIWIGKQIGRGANGKILEAKWEGIVVAVKEIHSIFMNEVSKRSRISVV